MKDDVARMTEAADWFAALRRNVMTIEERAAFDRWSENADNRAALARVEHAWETVGAMAPLVAQRSVAGSGVGSRRALLRVGGSALAASVAIGVFGAYRAGLFFRPEWDGGVETGIGEQREITLSEGSVIQLNVTSKIRWRLSGGERQIALDSGDALFTVTKDAARPFTVLAAGGTIRVLGTVFAVTAGPNGGAVAVREGHVALTPPPASAGGEAQQLITGQSMQFSRGGVGPIIAVSPDQVGEWRDRFVSFKSATLDEVAQELGRYFPVRILVDPPAAAARRVTLRLKLADEDATLSLLGKLLDSRIDRTAGGDAMLRVKS